MTTQYTPILKLALPVTGELSGSWGDVVNDNITSMVEQAIAGLATINTWTTNSHTLTTANGTTAEARCAMLVAETGAGGTALTAAGEIICPASSKLYILKNSSAYAVTLKTSGGTGIAVPAGQTAFLFCDGTNVNACVTTVVNGTVSGNLTLSGGTANGVAYLNGSKVLTSGSALTYNGTRLTIGGVSAGVAALFIPAGDITSDVSSGSFAVGNYGDSSSELRLSTRGFTTFRTGATDGTNGSEQMRLTSTGLGIGTSSPGYKLDVSGTIRATTGVISSGNVAAGGLSGDGALSTVRSDNTSAIASAINFGRGTAAGTGFNISTTGDGANGVTSFLIRKDGTSWVNLTDGNLGLGVTPSAWGSDTKAIQLGGSVFSAFAADLRFLGLANARWDGTNFRYLNTVPALQYRMSAGTGAHEWYTAPSGTAGDAISFTQAMTLTGGDVTELKLFSNGSGTGSGDGLSIIQNNGDAYLYNRENGPLLFGTNNAERLRIDSSGNLLVGRTTNATGNENSFQSRGADTVLWLGNSSTAADGGYSLACVTDAASGSARKLVYFGVGIGSTTNVGTITTNGTNTSYNTTSDHRLKNITGPITTSGAYIDSLNPVEGTWKADGSTFVGLIAHEVQEASRTNVATGVKDGEEMQAMDYSNAELIANLIAEVKSLRARVAVLEAK